MKIWVLDGQQMQGRVGLWTPWGVQYCVREDAAARVTKATRGLQTGQWSPLPAQVSLCDHKPEQAPRR